MRQIIKRSFQKVTSWYGWRIGFKLFHRGVDLRSYTNDRRQRLLIVLPENCIYLRTKWQKKWGYTHVFKGLESGYTLKFTHVEARDFIVGIEYGEGFAVGGTITTPYMKKKGLGEHLHFEVWGLKGMKPFNPVKYFKKMRINYE